MKNIKRSLLTFACISFLVLTAYSQSTEFTYQGDLKDGANPANGNYDFEFALYDALSGGTQLGSTLARNGLAVVKGVFSVSLDFGSQFPGTNRFLEIHVRPSGGGSFTNLTPRQKITSDPYSIRSLSADISTNATTATNATQLGGVAANQYLLTNGNGSGLTNLNAGNITTGTLAVANGGTGSATKNFVDLSTDQSGIGGNKTFTGTLSGNVVNAATQFNISGVRILSNGGNNNLFAGQGAGNAGTNNAYFGKDAGNLSTSFSGSNSFFGASAGFKNDDGGNNTFVGASAGFNSTGSLANGNTFVGSLAGNGNTTGRGNTMIGFQADVPFPSVLNNATAVGSRAFVTQDNSLVLGSISGVNNATADTNVGIGTTAPTERLHVVGNGLFTGNVTFSGALNGNGSGLTSLNAGNITTGTLALARGGTGSTTQNFVDLSTDQNSIGGNKTLTGNLNVNGNLGIGTTTPQQRLSVSDGMNIDQNSLNSGTLTNTLRFGTGNSGEAIGSKRTAGGNQFGLDFYTASSNRMSITVGGNVGIGTATPTSKLYVSGAGGVRANVNSDSNAGVGLTLNNAPKWSLATVSPGQFQIFNDAIGQNAVWIDNTNNNVGIGSTSPAAKLEVNGYTKLGSDAPSIRVKKLTGTTAATEGNWVTIPHGLDSSKILSVTVMVYTSVISVWVGPNYLRANSYHFTWDFNSSDIFVTNISNQSSGILSSPIKILIIYEQ